MTFDDLPPPVPIMSFDTSVDITIDMVWWLVRVVSRFLRVWLHRQRPAYDAHSVILFYKPERLPEALLWVDFQGVIWKRTDGNNKFISYLTELMLTHGFELGSHCWMLLCSLFQELPLRNFNSGSMMAVSAVCKPPGCLLFCLCLCGFPQAALSRVHACTRHSIGPMMDWWPVHCINRMGSSSLRTFVG